MSLLGQTVIYHAKRVPEAAAIVIADHGNGAVNLIVFMPNGHHFPAFNVTQTPATPVEHYWKVHD